MISGVIAAVLLLFHLTKSSVLVILPANTESLLKALTELGSHSDFPISVDILACNEEDIGDSTIDDTIIDHRYFSNVLCNGFASNVSVSYDHLQILEFFRLEILRPSIFITNEIDIVLSAISQASFVLLDSFLLDERFMKVIQEMIQATTQGTELSELFDFNSSIRLWKFEPQQVYSSNQQPIESQLLDEDSVRYLQMEANRAHTMWREGLYSDRDCNCGVWRRPNVPSCYDMDGTEEILEHFKVHPLSASQVSPLPSLKKQLLCMVYTHAPRHSSVGAVIDTWGKRCDGFIAWSNDIDHSISAVHIYNVRLNGTESYEAMWYKVISIWEMVVNARLTEMYEYFYLCGDDVYVMVNNLRQYLSSDFMVRHSDHGRLPVYLGRKVQHNHYLHYASGGSGYVLNAKAVELLVPRLTDEECFYDVKVSMEDVMIANCLLSALGVKVIDTRDAQGQERFHLWKISDMFNYSYTVNRYEGHMLNMKAGMEGFSPYSIAFHLMTPNDYIYCVDEYFQSVTPQT